MTDCTSLAIPVPGPGRNSLYREEYADQARKLCLLGAVDRELADFFGVTEQTINNWKNEHPAFFESLRAGKMKADAEVADSLYRRATGHQVTVEKLVKGEGGKYEAIRYQQFIPSDPQAAFNWLRNRRRQDWTDRQVHEMVKPSDPELREEARREVEEIFSGAREKPPTPHEIVLGDTDERRES